MMYRKYSFLEYCAIFFISLTLIAAVLSYLAWSWTIVIQAIWEWFVIPSFYKLHLEPLTFSQGLTINVCLSLMAVKVNHHTPSKADDNDISFYYKMLINSAIAPWVILGVSYFIKIIFMG